MFGKLKWYVAYVALQNKLNQMLPSYQKCATSSDFSNISNLIFIL